jgi:hypothetical protein
MGFFTAQTKVVDLGNGNSVTLHKLTYGESIEASSRALVAGNFDPFRHSLERLLASVQAWEGKDFEGQPVTPENIKALPLEVTRKLNDALVKLNNDISDDEGNASGAATN